MNDAPNSRRTQKERHSENEALRARIEELENDLESSRVKLLRAQSKLKEALASITDGMVTVDKNWRFVELNDQAERIIGMSKDQLLGAKIWDLFPEAVSTKFYDSFHQVVETQQAVHFEEYYSKPLNLWAECHCYPTGEGLSIYFRNITERKQAEERIREAAGRLQAIFDGTTDYMFLLSPNGILLEANRASLSFAGSSREEVLGLPFWETVWFRFTPGTPETIRGMVMETAGGKFVNFESAIITPSGHERTFLISFYPVRDESDRVILIVPSGRDVSEIKRGEIALRASETRFRKIFNHAATGIAIIDSLGHFVECNPAYCDLLGYTIDEVRKLNFKDVIHPEDLAVNLDQVQRLQNDEISSFEIENRYVRKDGEEVWVHKFASLLRNQAGEPETILGLVTNITHRRKIEMQLREAGTRKDEFLAMLGHELRNPLAAIRYAVQMAKRIPDDAAREFANEVVHRQSKQLTRMVDDLLDVARIERGRVDLKLERLNLATVLGRACDASKPIIEQKHHSLSIQCADDHLWVDGDPARLEQVIGNLLNNAAKYTPEGGEIHIACWRRDFEACISIADNGVGIPDALLPHVFDLFRQSEAPLDRSNGGLGIGLTIAKSLVEMHGGHIIAVSDGPGHGTTFTVSIPLIQEPAPPNHSGETEKSALASRTIRVLVVDDHIDTASALARILARRNCEVRVTHDGVNALQVAEEFRPEIFLLDLGLPGIDGYNIAKTLRANPIFANTVIIAISGYAQESDCKRALAAGFDHHCPKPLDVTSLLEIIFSRFEALH